MFTAPATTLFGQTSGHRLAFSTDPAGIDTVLFALPIANLRVFTSPELEQRDLDEEDVERLTTEAPDDTDDWLASRPFLQASTIDDHLAVGHLRGRGFSYQVGELTDGARACGPAPLPDDVIGWLTSQPYLEVVAPEREVDVGGWPARVADVRALAVPSGIPCPDRVGTCVMPFAHAGDAFPMAISSEYVTRVVDLTVGKSRVLITADLGTPGEPLLDSLRAFDLVGSR